MAAERAKAECVGSADGGGGGGGGDVWKRLVIVCSDAFEVVGKRSFNKSVLSDVTR